MLIMLLINANRPFLLHGIILQLFEKGLIFESFPLFWLFLCNFNVEPDCFLREAYHSCCNISILNEFLLFFVFNLFLSFALLNSFVKSFLFLQNRSLLVAGMQADWFNVHICK